MTDNENRNERNASAQITLEIFALASNMNAISDLDTLLQKIGDTAEHLLDCEAASIMLLDESRRTLSFRVATGAKGSALKKMTLPVGDGIAGKVAQNGECVIVNDTASDPRFAGQTDRSTGFVTRQLLAVPMLLKGEIIGVIEAVNRRDNANFTRTDSDLLRSLADSAAVAVANAKLIRDHKNFFSHVLELLACTIETAKPAMESHPNHSAYLACAVGRRLGMDEAAYRYLYYAGLLHDIGYIGLRSQRFARVMPGQLSSALSDEDLHVIMSVRMLEGINILQGSLPIIRHHHENFDGTGFPDRLSGQAIPLGARILRLVEAAEDLRMTDSLHGNALRDAAVEMAKNGSGKQFDPAVVDAFVQLLGEGERIWEI